MNLATKGQNNYFDSDKILLMLLPFWTPLIPPLGIACLKSYLMKNGYNVKTVDANIEEKFRAEYEKYFDILKKYVPKDKGGNYYKIGRDVLRNHMMAHIRFKDRQEYLELIKMLIYKNFYTNFNEDQILELTDILENLYSLLKAYILDLIKKEKPTLVGLSVYRDILPVSLFTFKTIKENYPQIETVMGGGVFADQLAVGSPNMDYFLEETENYIDYILVGEGELLFLKLLNGELNKSQRLFTLEDIKGETVDISSLDSPDFSDFDIGNYPYLASYTSRSCPFQCKFCSETMQWGEYRKKQSKRIVEDLVKLYDKYQYQLFYLCDSLINPVISDLSREFIKTAKSIYWESCLRVENSVCNIENTLLWRRGGFYKARLGIESGSQRILNLMDKRTTVEQNKKALYNLASAGIKTLVFIIIGYPSETEEDFEKTLDFIEELQDYIYEIEPAPFEYYLTGQANSMDGVDNDKNLLLYPENAKDLFLAQTWIIDSEPKREEIYSRFNRFLSHLDKLNIPNPYSMNDIIKADERWMRIHKNAVPPMIDFLRRDRYIEENKPFRRINIPNNILKNDGEFSF